LAAADESRVTLLYAAAWCALAVGLLVFDWRFWPGRSSSPRPPVQILPLAGRA
jgi:hypothetical protein